MKVLLTGGSGNLGQTLVPRLMDRGDTPVILDVRAPPVLHAGAVFIEGSLLDRSSATTGCGTTAIFRCSCIAPAAPEEMASGPRLDLPTQGHHRALAAAVLSDRLVGRTRARRAPSFRLDKRMGAALETRP